MPLRLLILLIPAVFLSACAPLAWWPSAKTDAARTPAAPAGVESTAGEAQKNGAAPILPGEESRRTPAVPEATNAAKTPDRPEARGAADSPSETKTSAGGPPPAAAREESAAESAAAAPEPDQIAAAQPAIPLVMNDRVRHFVNLYSKNQRVHFERVLARSGKYLPRIAEILREENVPEDLVYIALVESSFSPTARSPSNALGLWQFVRNTALHYGLKIDWWVDERKDPFKATRAAAAYFKDLYGRFGRWHLAAAAYNAGSGRLARAMAVSGAKDFWSLSARNDLSEETRNFVPKFIAASLIAREPARYGLDEIAYEPPLAYDKVEIHNALRLDIAARLAQTTVAEIRDLNPALLRNFTPPAREGFTLRVPAGRGEAFIEAYDRDHRRAQERVLVHRIKRGETLSGIAKKYGTRVVRLMEENGLKNYRIKTGDHLIVVAGEARQRR